MGRSGSACERTALVTPSAFSLPLLMCGIADGRLSNITSMLPPIRSISAGPEPRYGMWTMKVPVMVLNSSPARWMLVPLPELAMFSRPGAPFSAFTKSATLFTPSFCAVAGFITSTLGTPATSVTGAKSLMWS